MLLTILTFCEFCHAYSFWVAPQRCPYRLGVAYVLEFSLQRYCFFEIYAIVFFMFDKYVIQHKTATQRVAVQCYKYRAIARLCMLPSVLISVSCVCPSCCCFTFTDEVTEQAVQQAMQIAQASGTNLRRIHRYLIVSSTWRQTYWRNVLYCVCALNAAWSAATCWGSLRRSEVALQIFPKRV